MGSAKDYLFEVEQERFQAWVLENHGIELEPDDDHELWDSLATEYSAIQEAEADEAEHRWLERHSHNQFFYEFSEQIDVTSSLLTLQGNTSQADTVLKLAYAHAVTLLETLISSVVRKLVVSDPDMMRKVAAGYDNLSKKTFTLKEIAEQPKLIEIMVLKELSGLTFHNPATIKSILSAMFGEHMKGLELGPIAKICNKRHDIVHRNGRTVDELAIELSQEEASRAIVAIRAFAMDLKKRIYTALDEQESEVF